MVCTSECRISKNCTCTTAYNYYELGENTDCFKINNMEQEITSYFAISLILFLPILYFIYAKLRVCRYLQKKKKSGKPAACPDTCCSGEDCESISLSLIFIVALSLLIAIAASTSGEKESEDRVGNNKFVFKYDEYDEDYCHKYEAASNETLYFYILSLTLSVITIFFAPTLYCVGIFLEEDD